MAFNMMRERVPRYDNLEDLQTDLDLIWSNCQQFNASNSIFVRECLKLKKAADAMISKTAAVLNAVSDDEDQDDSDGDDNESRSSKVMRTAHASSVRARASDAHKIMQPSASGVEPPAPLVIVESGRLLSTNTMAEQLRTWRVDQAARLSRVTPVAHEPYLLGAMSRYPFAEAVDRSVKYFETGAGLKR